MRNDREFTIRRADCEAIMSEYSFMVCAGPDDWEVAEAESEWHESPTEYVIEQWVKVGEWSRTFGEPEEDEDDDEVPA